jgi:hypothetical protein
MVTGLTGYRIAAGPFSQKIVRLIFNATYSSVTTGKYLIIFVDWGKKVGDAPQRSRERKGKIQMPKLKN